MAPKDEGEGSEQQPERPRLDPRDRAIMLAFARAICDDRPMHLHYHGSEGRLLKALAVALLIEAGE